MSQTLSLQCQYCNDLILNPRVGEISLISSPLNFLMMVVLPALSRPSTSNLISFYCSLAFFTIDIKPIFANLYFKSYLSIQMLRYSSDNILQQSASRLIKQKMVSTANSFKNCQKGIEQYKKIIKIAQSPFQGVANNYQIFNPRQVKKLKTTDYCFSKRLLKTYESKKKMNEKAAQTIKRDIQRCIEDESISALKIQNYKVNNIHKNQQIIEAKLKKQHQMLAEFRKNQDMWRSLYQQLNRALMEAGDLVHYSGYVEAEIAELLGEGTVAQYLQKADREESAQETDISLKDVQSIKDQQQTHAQQLSQNNNSLDPTLEKQGQK